MRETHASQGISREKVEYERNAAPLNTISYIDWGILVVFTPCFFRFVLQVVPPLP
jgi:hypothetical protein